MQMQIFIANMAAVIEGDELFMALENAFFPF